MTNTERHQDRKIIGMGETILDILFRGRQPVAAVHGGSSFNGIISAARAGVECVFVGYTGGDIVGEQTVDFMRQNGVGTDYLQIRSEEKSAISLAFLSESGDASYVFHKGTPLAGNLWTLPPVNPHDILIYGSYYACCPGMRPLVEEMLRRMNEHEGIVYYDLNFRRPHLKELNALMHTIQDNYRCSTIVRGSADDFDVMFSTRDARTVYREHIAPFCPLFICTAGAKSVTVCTPTGCYDFPVPPVSDVVSTVGAGDNFNAGFACALIRYGIHREEFLALPCDLWQLLIADACDFAANACESTDNYITASFGREYSLRASGN